MFWKDAPLTIPQNGETRQRLVFAWKPSKVDGGTVWLERYSVAERYFSPSGGGPGWWSETARQRGIWYP